MANVVRTVIQLRRAHTEEWLQYKDVVPAAGEPCFDLDLHTLRIGDGVLTYENLPVIGGVDVKVEADGKSIVLEEGVFKLMGFDAAEVGAQPRKTADDKIEWVVPADVDVEELEKTVSTLQTNVTNLETTVVNIQEIVGVSAEGGDTLLSRIDTLEEKMDGTGEGSVDAKIDAKIELFAGSLSENGKVDTLMELIRYVETHGEEAADMASDIKTLQDLVGTTSVQDQILAAIEASGHMDEEKANTIFEHVKYEITDAPVGTLVDYRDKEIRVMCPSNTVWTKQAVGAGGDANSYYATFKTYAPNDNVVGYIEHLNGQVDSEILTNFSTDKYGRRYQPTWLALAKYDETTGWTYYGKNSTAKKYIGYDYQIDWYDADGVMVASDKIRINLSNEDCHHNIEPYFMGSVVKSVSVGGTLLDIVDGKVEIPAGAGLKSSEEIVVAEDGTLSVGEINISKIKQDETETLVLDGGGASV